LEQLSIKESKEIIGIAVTLFRNFYNFFRRTILAFVYNDMLQKKDDEKINFTSDKKGHSLTF